MQSTDIKDILLAAKDLIAVVVPLVSIWITQNFLASRESDKVHRDYVQRKLDEFYGPMLSMVFELRARNRAYEEVLSELTKEGEAFAASPLPLDSEVLSGDAASPQEMTADTKLEVIQSMQNLYREKLWMAEKSTIELFQPWIALVEISSNQPDHASRWKIIHDYEVKHSLLEKLQKDLEHQKFRFMKELDL